MAVNANYSGPVTSAVMIKETTFGTDPGTGYTNMGMYVNSLDAEISVDTTRVNALGVRESQALVGTAANVTGTIDGLFQDARLIAYAMGADAVTDAAGVYTHWINYKTAAASPIEVSSLPSFTMVVTRGTDVMGSTAFETVETYTGCRITNLRIKGDLGAPLNMTADFIAKNVSVALNSGGQAAAFSTDEVHPPQYITLSIPNSTAISQVQSFDLTINNNVERVGSLGTQLLQASPAKQLEIDLNGTIAMTDEAIWAIQKITNDTSGASTFASVGAPKVDETVKIVSTNSGATTAARTLTINIGAAAFTKQSVSTKVGDVTMLDFTCMIRDFTQTNWGAVPTGAPITFVNATAGAYLA